MTIKDINTIIETLCPNDEDYEKPIISPKYLRQELEQLALEQEHRHLDQEPTTKNDLTDDCISRKAVLDELGKWDWQELYLPIHFKENIVDVLPSVTSQEPKTGHWISTETKGVRYAFWCRYKCSLCGGLSDRTNFCPNCGARMVAPQESEG